MHVGELLADVPVVLGDLVVELHVVQHHVHRRRAAPAREPEVRGRGGRNPASAIPSTRALASVSRKSRLRLMPSARFRKPISRASSAEVATFAVPMVRNSFFRKGSGSKSRVGGERAVEVAQQHEIAAAAGDQAHAHLDQAHVQLGRGLDGVARPSSPRRRRPASGRTARPPPGPGCSACAGWRPGSRRPSSRTEPRSSLLMAMSRAMMFAPAREVRPVVADDQSAGRGFSARSSALFIIATMSSSMEFILVWNSSRSDAVAHVPDAWRCRCPSSLLVAAAQVLDAEGARVLLDRRRLLRRDVPGGVRRAVHAVEALAAGGEHLLHPRRGLEAQLLHPLHALAARRTRPRPRTGPRSQAKPQRSAAVDVDEVVGDLRDAAAGVGERRRASPARRTSPPCPSPVSTVPDALGDVVDALGRAERVEADLLLRPVLERLRGRAPGSRSRRPCPSPSCRSPARSCRRASSLRPSS